MSAAKTLPVRERPSARSAETQPPRTTGSATVTILPRSTPLGNKHDAANLVAVIKMNVEFLRSVLRGGATPVALEAVEDIATMVDRLEEHVSSSVPVGLRRTG